jgi:superfamily II DNA helicase RecQ
MKYKFFTIPARDPEAAETALNAFCNQHRVSFVEKQLIADGADSFWSVCVSWQDGEAAPSQGVSAANQPKVDYKELLSEEDFSAYLELRNFRKGMAEAKGVPSYALFTNDQLAAMVQQRVGSKSALQAIPGIGKSRVDKYGDAFLQKLNDLWVGLPIQPKVQGNETDTDNA